jgi:signal transduction histidine kinase
MTRPLRRPAWLRLPRRTARLRLTALYGSLFLLSGVALLASTYVLFERATKVEQPRLPQIPHAPTIQSLQLPQALLKLTQDQHRLAEALPPLTYTQGTSGAKVVSPLRPVPRLIGDQAQLIRSQHQLDGAVEQLTRAVHQLAQAGTAQAAQRSSDSHQLLVDSGIALAVVGLLALLAGWLVAGRMLRPIRTITRAARRISSTSLHERLSLDGPEDELKELGDTLDELFARLEASFEAQRHFVANASHELRSPLTRERTLVQVALGDPSTSDAWRSTGEALLASNRKQESLIEALLTLASSESELDRWERADLADVCRSVLPRPDQVELQIETALEPAAIDGDPRLVERLLANLVDNALTHNVPGGRVRIATGATDGRAVLSVTNTGPVVPADEVDRLFQPFQRLDARRGQREDGHGLGLSIVRAIAAAHRAAVTAEPLPDGGLSVRVAFASAADASHAQAGRNASRTVPSTVS